MNKIVLHLSTILIMVVAIPAQAQAMTCAQFNALGAKASTLEEVINTPATVEQSAEYKEVIAVHAGDLGGFGFSSKKKALQLVSKNNQLTMVLRESLGMTMAFCFGRPNDSMQKVAIEQFDYLLNAIAKKNNL